MRNILRAAGGGAALGAAFFVAPVLGRVVVGVGLLGVAARLLGGGGRRAARRSAWRAAFEQCAGRPLPIDGQPTSPGAASPGPVHSVALG